MAAVVVLAACAVLLAYVFLGYPWAMRTIVAMRGPRTVRKADITPRVTLIVSAFNEAAVIRQKVENALSLDYPAEQLDVVVISDASDDGTDEIVKAFASDRVSLVRQVDRRGKTAGLNAVVLSVRGDIVVFSDANAMYRADAIRNLARNFADDQVGCVTGEARYVKGTGTAADVGEHAYWDYEMQIKRLETAVGSMVGGDGAIYAIRKSLWKELPENAINDFLNPLQIVAAGWRNVYEPEAVAFEETAGDVRREYKRRVRIVSRSWRAVFQAPGVLNPFRVGLFSFCLLSHKVLRWWAALILAVGVVAGVVVSLPGLASTPWWAYLVLIVGGAMLFALPPVRRVVGLGWYFLTLSVASLVGAVKGSVGRVSGVWTPPREGEGSKAPTAVLSSTSTFLTALGWLAIGMALAQLLATRSQAVAFALYGVALSVLTYVYVGYPVLMGVAARVAGRPVRRGPRLPAVSVVIAAYNEAPVIGEKLQNTLAQDYPADLLEVILVSDGSDDGTAEAARAAVTSRVRLIEVPERRGKISAVNLGIEHASHEVVVLTDANCFLAPNAIRALVANFEDPEVAVVSGDVELTGDRAALGNSEDLYYGYERWLQRVESWVWTMVSVDGALYAVRRGGFRSAPADTILDDMAIPLTFVMEGSRIVFEPGARAVEGGTLAATEEFWRKARVVAGGVQYLSRIRRWRQLPMQFSFSLISHKVLRWLTPLFLFSLFISSLLLLNHPIVGWWAFIVQVVFYSLGLMGCHTGLRRLRLIGLVHYFCLVQAGAAAGLVRGLLGRETVRWRRFARTGVHDSGEAVGVGR